MSYVEYYNSLKANKHETKDLLKFDFSPIYMDIVVNEDKVDLQLDKLKDYIDECIESKSYEKILNKISYDAVLNLDFSMYDKIGRELIEYMNRQHFGCNFEIHRAYLLKNKYQNEETENINCNKFHWKNEPKTMVTIYIMLGSASNCMQILRHPVKNQGVKLPTNKDSVNEWGPHTHLRYKDCKLNDGQVKEFEYYGFKKYDIKFISGYKAFIMGSNVVHRHMHNNNRYLVLKMRPAKDDITLLTNEEIQLRIGDILDLEVFPKPY
jgi:hypothetical protein